MYLLYCIILYLITMIILRTSSFFSHHINHKHKFKTSSHFRIKVRQMSDSMHNNNQMNNMDNNNNRINLEKLVNGQINSYWLDKLSNLERSAAINLIKQLTKENSLGFDIKKGSSKLFDLAIKTKEEYNDKVIIIQNGEFYETFGIDAIMLINYCGLNPMVYILYI